MARGNRLGFENVDEGVDAEEGAGEVAERPEESVETQLVETKEEEAEDAVAEADGDQLIEDLRAVVEQAEVVIESLEEGGMSEAAARSTEIATESIAKRWNLSRKKLGVENFRGSNRVNATRLGLEGILDTASGLGRRVLEWIMKRINDIRGIWDKYVNVGKSARGRIEKLRAKVRDLRGTVDSDDTLPAGMGWQLGPVLEAMGKKSDVDVKTPKDLNDVLDKLDEGMGVYLDAAGDLIESARGSSGSIREFKSGIELVTGSGGEVKLKKLFPAAASEKDRKIIPFVGGAILRYKDVDGNLCYKWTDVTASMYREQELKPLTPEQMKTYLDEAFDTANTLNQFYQKRRKSVAAMEKLKTSIGKAKDKFGKAFDKKDADSASLEDKRKDVEKAKVAFDNAVQMDIIFRKSAAAFIQVSVAIVQASMKKYKVED